MSGTDIFLSYARQDRGTAHMFAQAFADEGFSVWWDASLHSGETFDEVIEQKLRDAKAVVVLWSPRSVASRWVRAEATQADRRNKLAPAIIEPCDRPVIFELTHAADLTEWTGDTSDIAWRTFMDDLRRLVDVEPQAEVAATARPAARSPSPRTAEISELRSRHAAAGRQALRPGSDQVLHADGAPRAAPLRPAPQPAASPSDVHYLEIADGALAEEPIVIDSSSVRIGRSAPADIVLPDKSISREHCIIGLANDELFVTDLNSTNGTYIDEVRIDRATILPVGSVLRIGQVSLKHSLHSADAQHGGRGMHGGRFAAAS